MTAVDLINGTQELGIALWVEDGKLKFRSPAELDEELKHNLKQHKTEIIQLIQPKPYIKNGSELIIPSGCHPKYRWWDNGQSVFETLLELDAPDSMIENHIGELGSSKHWRQWQAILKERIVARPVADENSPSLLELFKDLKPEETP
jgi:TubC N-terminal docking domain